MYKVITPPAAEPVTLSELKAQTRYDSDDTSQDTILTTKLIAARSWIEGYLGIAMIHQTIELRYPCFTRSGIMPLEVTPIAGSLVVKYIAHGDTSLTTMDGADYELEDYSSPPTVHIYTIPELNLTKAMPVRMTYQAGYGDSAADVPAPLREAILILASTMEVERTAGTGYNKLAPTLVGHLIHQYKNEYARL